MSCRGSTPGRVPHDERELLRAPHSPRGLADSLTQSLLERPVYSYIVTTITTNSDRVLQQNGSAPNFGGGRITLCTCKHKDRATFCPSGDASAAWDNVWVAGLTSKTQDPSRSLAYVMLVERSFPNQWELWNYLPEECRRAKSASHSVLGDVFEPKAGAEREPHNPANYSAPIKEHVHSPEENPNMWHHDVMQWGRRSVSHRLLLGDPEWSFRWRKAEMVMKPGAVGATAHHKLFTTLRAFIDLLEKYEP